LAQVALWSAEAATIQHLEQIAFLTRLQRLAAAGVDIMARLVQLVDLAVAAVVRLAAQRQAAQEIHQALHPHRAIKAATP
jgi:hypothetical protein